MRIHVFGASGSGTTTLGRALAADLGVPFLDADDFFWERTDPPFQVVKERAVRQRELQAAVAGHASWVVSGSIMGWGDVLIPELDLAIYLFVPPELRLARLRARERERYGARLDPGNDLHATHLAFMSWAARYDQGGLDVRSRASHAQWMEQLTCRLLRLEGDQTTERRLQMVREAMRGP